jgi:hypothetical protein
MIHKSKVLYGVASYIDDEIVAKLAGSWKAWAVGGMAGIAVSRADGLLSQLANNPMVKALGLIDGENIDVEAIVAELRKQAQKGAATVDIPMIGPVTFGPADVDSLYRHIMQAGGGNV